MVLMYVVYFIINVCGYIEWTKKEKEGDKYDKT